MAFIALGFLVFFLQRELGVLVMVEALGRLPVAGTVTFLALFAQRTVVLVVLLVARDTSRLQFFTHRLVAA